MNSGDCLGCRNGYYGSKCAEACGHCEYGVCLQLDGACSPCSAGSFGPTCNSLCFGHCLDNTCNQQAGNCAICSTGYFGDYCNETCAGCADGLCSREGYCLNGCDEGWKGDYCDIGMGYGCIKFLVNFVNIVDDFCQLIS